MKQAIKQLEMGYKFLLFPEGTGSPKGGILPFKAGAFIIARMANVPAQPVIIRNNPPFMPHEDHWYYPPFEISSIEIEFLEPITPPLRGEERKTAAELEKRFREALYISESLTKSNDCGESNL
jgi:1-acyl-sn-glycerol-3-phosphate acyltransferase